MIRTVVVTIEGGVVQHVECPPGVRVVVRDYDVGESDPSLLKTDETGQPMAEWVWTENPEEGGGESQPTGG